MSFHRVCCCGPNPANPCGDSCDWATSYTLSGFSGSHSWTRIRRADPCEGCSDYDGHNLAESYGFTATFTQAAPVTLTRTTYGTGESATCCYQATGVMNVAWTLSANYKYYNCPINNGICEYNDLRTGTEQTDFCIVAQCRQNPLTGRYGWLWTLTVCSFWVSALNSIDVSNLPENYDCGDEPPLGNDHQIVAGGAMWSWWTELVAPNTIGVFDAINLGCCVPAEARCGSIFPGTDPEGLESGCMVTMQQMVLEYGPCSLADVAVGTLPIDPCEVYVVNWPGTFYDCQDVGPLPGACSGQIDYADACCEVNLSHAWTWGLIY